MDVRKITVVSTRDQKRTIVETSATTLGELKAALTNANVDHSDMTFYEALTRTEFLTDDSILPHDVPYKGKVTNELVFMLTNPNKKIKSGALSEARLALYNEILEKNYMTTISERFGKNFTNCSNAELASFLDDMNNSATACNCVDSAVRSALVSLLNVLHECNCIGYEHVKEISAILNVSSGAAAVHTPASPYSDEELSDLLTGINEFVR